MYRYGGEEGSSVSTDSLRGDITGTGGTEVVSPEAAGSSWEEVELRSSCGGAVFGMYNGE